MTQHFTSQGLHGRAFRGIGSALLGAVVGLLSACAHDANQQVWTTKQQSALGVKTDVPSLNVNDDVAVGSSVSAADLRPAAISVLLQAAESNSALLRSNAIEALQWAPDQIEPAVRRGLGDDNRAVRFAATMMVGRLKLHNLASLVEPLLHDDSQSVRAAAMYSLRRNGKRVDLNPLAGMLNGDDPETKGNAAFVLGELGEKSAVPLLRQAVGRGMAKSPQARRKVVDLQIAEALVKLGENDELEVIRAALFAPLEEAELAAFACQLCGELRDGSALPDLNNLIHRSGKDERPPEIRMAAALAMATINPARALVEVPVSYSAHARPELRAQAALTLGAMRAGGKGSQVALAHLSRLLNDADPMVQVAAAGGILRMQSRSAG